MNRRKPKAKPISAAQISKRLDRIQERLDLIQTYIEKLHQVVDILDKNISELQYGES